MQKVKNSRDNAKRNKSQVLIQVDTEVHHKGQQDAKALARPCADSGSDPAQREGSLSHEDTVQAAQGAGAVPLCARGEACTYRGGPRASTWPTGLNTMEASALPKRQTTDPTTDSPAAQRTPKAQQEKQQHSN